MYYWHFKRWDKRKTANEGEDFRINRYTFPLPITPDLVGRRDNLAKLEYLVTFVSDLFKIERICHVMDADVFNDFQIYFSDRIVNRKLIRDHFIFSAWHFYDDLAVSHHFKNEDVHFILDSLPDDIELSFSGQFEDDFQYEKLLTQKKISTHSGKWMTSEQLLNSKFQQLKVWNGHNFTLEDYNLFMRKWLKHELSEDYQYIFMELPYKLYKKDWHKDEKQLNVILNGLDVKEYDHTRNLEDYPDDPALWERDKLFDIHRDDGMIATLVLDSKVLKFRVWVPEKDRSPY